MAKPKKSKRSKRSKRLKPVSKKTKKAKKNKTKSKKRARSLPHGAKPAKPARRKSRKKPATKRIFEKRPKLPEAPPEFTIRLRPETQDEAYASIKARLEDARANLPEGTESRIIIHPYADGSVDGELYVKIPTWEDTREMEWDLHEAFGKMAVGTRYWISTGVRYIIEKDDIIYRRFKGMNQLQTNYQRASQHNIVEEHVILRHTILPGTKKRFKREAHSVFIRLHWNPNDEHPKR